MRENNNNCGCMLDFHDVYNVNNTVFNGEGAKWDTSYLCDFKAMRDESGAVPIPHAVQGMSLHFNGTKAIAYLINQATGDDAKVSLVEVDLVNNRIIADEKRNRSTDNIPLGHCNGATSYVDVNNIEHSVTCNGTYLFDTIIYEDGISTYTTSIEVKKYDNYHLENTDDIGAVSYDSISMYWYVSSGGNLYRSYHKHPNEIPTEYHYIASYNTSRASKYGGISLNQSMTVYDNKLYSVSSYPNTVDVYNIGDRALTLECTQPVKPFGESYTMLECENIQYSPHFESWICSGNGRFIDEFFSGVRRQYNYITFTAVGGNVVETNEHTFSTNAHSGTFQGGGGRNIELVLDDTDIEKGYYVGEYIRHTGFNDEPFRTIGSAMNCACYLRNQEQHFLTTIIVTGLFGDLISHFNVTKDMRFHVNANSSLPKMVATTGVSLDIQGEGPETSVVNKVEVQNNADAFLWNINFTYCGVNAGGNLTANGTNGEVTANGQSVIILGGTGNMSGTISNSIAFVGSKAISNNFTFNNCVNLRYATVT